MGLTDRFGLSLSTVSAEAAASYVAGIDLLLSANVGAEVQLERAVAVDPNFALAHIARARMQQLRAHAGGKGCGGAGPSTPRGCHAPGAAAHRHDRARRRRGCRRGV